MALSRIVSVSLAACVILAVPTFAHARGGGRGGGRSAPPVQQKQPNPTLVADRQAVTDTQKALETARTTYNTKLADMQKELRKAPEYTDARKAYEEAQKAMEAARLAVLAKLKTDNADYKAAAKKESDAAKKLEQIRSTATRDEIAAQSKVKLDAGSAMDKIEKTALDADQPYLDAKKAVADTKAVVDALDAKYVETLNNDDTIKGLKQAVTSAQEANAAAKKKLEEDTKNLPAMI